MATLTKAELIKLQKEYSTDEAIGKTIGITRQAIHQLRKKYGIDSVAAKTPERNEKIVEMHSSGKTGTAIAEKLGMSISQVYRVINSKKK